MTPERLVIEALFNIPNKNGEKVPFKLNNHQIMLDDNIAHRNIIPKARQLGFSTYVLARFLAKCITQDNRRCVIIAHQSEATQRLLGRIQYIIKHMNCATPSLKINNRNEMYFSKTDSVLYIGTAGNQDFAVGDTITDLHASECSRWPNPGPLLMGLFQAVSSTGEIFIESTGHGVNNWFHRACLLAQKGKLYKLHFFPWNNEETYKKALSEDEKLLLLSNLNEDLDEPMLLQDKWLNLEQLAWRRDKIDEMEDIRAFKEQYPLTLDECFQNSSDSFFIRIRKGHSEWIKDLEEYKLMRRSDLVVSPEKTYIMGIDPAFGVGRDNSVVEIVEITDEGNDQVAEWASNKVQPEDLIAIIIRLWHRFNHPYIVCERNSLGQIVLRNLMKGTTVNGTPIAGIPSHYIHYEKGLPGVQTTASTKPKIIGELRMELSQHMTVNSPDLLNELSTFTELDNGALEAQNGSTDDRVMAMAMLVRGLPRALVATAPRERPNRQWPVHAKLYAR